MVQSVLDRNQGALLLHVRMERVSQAYRSADLLG